jgi:hypothetical protein
VVWRPAGHLRLSRHAVPTASWSRFAASTQRGLTSERTDLATRWGARYGDSPQAVRAVELFLKEATPAAASTVDGFLSARHGATLDDFLLTNLRRQHDPSGDDQDPFVTEWQAFASGATAKARTKAAERAWAQWRAFGGEDDRAQPLHAIQAGEEAASTVHRCGVVRIDGCLSAASAEGLRAFVLETRDAAVALAAEDKAAGAERLSRVLSPRDAGCEVTTRWDVRLPWTEKVRDAVHEMMGDRDDVASLGRALSTLSGGDSAMLFECAAVISAEGCAPQIVHADTVPTDAGAVLHTAFVALQDISEHQGPTRFLPYTHTCPRSHEELERDAKDFCEGAHSVAALLRSGGCTLYDSRTLHCGGPHRARPHALPRASPYEGPPTSRAPVERVLFYVSFKHALATDAELTNSDVHGAGSILPSVAALRMSLGSLRNPAV